MIHHTEAPIFIIVFPNSSVHDKHVKYCVVWIQLNEVLIGNEHVEELAIHGLPTNTSRMGKYSHNSPLPMIIEVNNNFIQFPQTYVDAIER